MTDEPRNTSPGLPPPGPPGDAAEPPKLAPDGPTELVPGEGGELVERLSGGTATMLLAWLVGIGAASALLGVWFFVWLVSGTRLGVDALFGGPGLYTALAGASGPCVLWLAGRAQGHSLGWFLWTSARIGLVMIAFVAGGVALVALISGYVPGPGVAILAVVAAFFTVLISVIWAVATWSADRYIARARVQGE